MAKTIIDKSYNASSVGGGSDWYTFRTLVVENSTSTANNASNVTVTFSAKYNFSGAGFTGYTSPKAIIKIDNVEKKRETVSSLDSNWKVIATWTGDITHNENGEKNITVLCTFEPNTSVNYLPGGNTTGGSGALTKIARYTSISSFTVAKRNETSVTVNWKTADTIDYLWYSKDNGSKWTGLDVTDGTSGSFNIGSLSSNTKYNFKIRVRRKDSQLTTDSSTAVQTTYDYPYCTTMPDFTIGNSLKLSFYNPLNRNITVKLIGSDNSTIDVWTGTGTSVTGYNGINTINNLYASIPDSQSGKYKVSVLYGTSIKTKNGGNYKIKGTEKPIFTASQISYQDSDNSVFSITENNQYIVRNQSNLKISYTAADPKNYASIVKYEIIFNGTSQIKNTATTIDYGKINLASSASVSITVTDSRGLTSNATKMITILDWVLPTCFISAKRINNYEDATKIKAQWKFSSVNGKNSIQEMKFRYKKISDATWSVYSNLSNNIEKNIVIDKLHQWNLQIVIRDKFGSTTYNLIVPKGMPIMFFDTNKLAVGVNCFPSNNESFCVNGSDFLEYEIVDEW